jgi:DHA1 family multidrug resistance protein-like MFS transporter
VIDVPITVGLVADVTDTFREHQSAVYSVNDLCRSCFAGAFPLFAHAMYQRLGLGGANSMLGGFAILFIPAPFIFIKYDARIRAASKFTSKDDVDKPTESA